MKIRRFFAKDMRSVLNQVTAELGKDAAILSTNKVNGGVEVVAATDYDEALLHASQSAPRNSAVSNQSDHSANKQPEKWANLFNKPIERQTLNSSAGKIEREKNNESHLTRFLNRLSNEQIDEPNQEQASHVNPKQAKDKSSNILNRSSKTEQGDDNLIHLSDETFTSSKASNNASFPKIEWSQEPTLVAMREELNLLRTLLQEQVSEIAWNKKNEVTPVAVALQKALQKLGLAPHISEALVLQCQHESDFECAWQKALALLSKRLSVGEDDILNEGGVIALIGPTGVGKTTTIAKLAAKYVLKHGRNGVALITTDSFRIAAHEQIRTFGRLLQIPVKAVHDEATLRSALKQFSDKSLVLIDTAGMSQYDERMAQQMSCLASDEIHVKNYLVLSATSQIGVLNSAIKLFAPFHLAGCVVTKLDEATSLGEIISTIIDNQLAISYTTDGQRVPEDLRIARAHHLVSKMVWLERQSCHNEQPPQVTGTH